MQIPNCIASNSRGEVQKKLLQGALGEFVKRDIEYISKLSDFEIEEIESDKDHIHILMNIGTKYSVGQHVRRIKQQTTRSLWRDFSVLKQEFWKEKTFWSDGYFVCSVGNASADTIRKYIQQQG